MEGEGGMGAGGDGTIGRYASGAGAAEYDRLRHEYVELPSRIISEGAAEARRAAAMSAKGARGGTDDITCALCADLDGSSVSGGSLGLERATRRPSTAASSPPAGQGGRRAGGGVGHPSPSRTSCLAAAPSSSSVSLRHGGRDLKGSTSGSTLKTLSSCASAASNDGLAGLGGARGGRWTASTHSLSTPGGGTGMQGLSAASSSASRALLLQSSTSKRPPTPHTMALPKDTSHLPPKRGLPDALELRQLAGEVRSSSIGSRERLARLREVFEVIDEDGSGAISIDELGALFEHAEIAIDQAELVEIISDADVNRNGQLEFIEFLEAILQIGRRARAAIKERDAAGGGIQPLGGGGGAGGGTGGGEGGGVLQSMLAESRRVETPPARCLLLDQERAKARVFMQYQPTVTFKPASILHHRRPKQQPTGVADPHAERHTHVADMRGPIDVRRSELGDVFPVASHYIAALLLHCFLELTTDAADDEELGLGSEEAGPSVPVETLQRQHAWARLSGFPDTPPLSGTQWQGVLTRYVTHTAAVAAATAAATATATASSPLASGSVGGATPRLVAAHKGHDGRRDARVTQMRRVHPSERTPSLAGWDVLQLLSFFRVPSLADVPWADEQMLANVPLEQVWPTLSSSSTSSTATSAGGAPQLTCDY
jgi:hypothetical protein